METKDVDSKNYSATNQTATLVLTNNTVYGFTDVTLTHTCAHNTESINGDMLSQLYYTPNCLPEDGPKPIKFESGGDYDYWDITLTLYGDKTKKYTTAHRQCNLQAKDAGGLVVATVTGNTNKFYLNIIPAHSSPCRFELEEQ